tara:strand:+ start:350 stop:613 length:264 start_codon:yes stop_codon:yes gene_type:complete
MVRKLKWQMAELDVLAFVPRMVVLEKFRKLSLELTIQTDADKYASLVGQLPRARGLGVYDVALTWQRSRVRFSPSPPLRIDYGQSIQ